jgi:hypothetical protein
MYEQTGYISPFVFLNQDLMMLYLVFLLLLNSTVRLVSSVKLITEKFLFGARYIYIFIINYSLGQQMLENNNMSIHEETLKHCSLDLIEFGERQE